MNETLALGITAAYLAAMFGGAWLHVTLKYGRSK